MSPWSLSEMGRPSCRFADLIIASEIIIFRRRRRRVSLLAGTNSKSTPQHRSSAHTLSNHDKTRVKSTWILQPAVLDLYSPGLYISRTGSCNKPNSA
ncbi:hypothetical protein SRHO_G00026640 [Serrasalmus rhombeus]